MAIKNLSKTAKKATTAAKKATAKSTAKKATPVTKKPVQSVQRNYIDPTFRIVKKVTGNPRREGTFGHESFAKIKTGMTVEQFVSKGGRLRDLHWDLEHEYIELKKA